MRYAPMGVVLLLLASVPALAQSSKDIRVVKTATAEVWPFPSTKSMYYVTNRLNQGDTVEVVEERPDGWLKIRPPAGSTSWINTRFLKSLTPNQPTLVVAEVGVGVPVYPSPAERTSTRPSIEGVQLKRGHQVYGLSKVHRDEQGTWQEIESPDHEARYLRAESVRRAGADVVRTASTGTGGLQRSTAPSAKSVPLAEEMRRQAVQADNAGNTAEAIQRYDRISTQFAAAYPELARMCRARADYLRGELTERSSPQTTAAVSAVSRDKGGSAFTRNEGGEAATGRNGGDASVYSGYLSPAYSRVDGEPAHMLQLSRPTADMVRIYVVAGQGVNLTELTGKTIEVRGPIRYHGPSKAYLMRVQTATVMD